MSLLPAAISSGHALFAPQSTPSGGREVGGQGLRGVGWGWFGGGLGEGGSSVTPTPHLPTGKREAPDCLQRESTETIISMLQ